MSSYVFIDSRVADINTQIAGFADGTIIVVLDPLQAGISQMAASLAGCSNVESLHIVSHGADGTLYLGKTMLTGDNLEDFSSELAAIGAALCNEGDILLYGCDVAATTSGQHFIQQLAAYTNADVAASTNATGATALGGNWQLEAAIGNIEAASLSAVTFGGLLDVINGDNNANNLMGTANADLITGLDGNDTIDGAAGSDRSIYGAGSAGYNFSLSGSNIIVTDTNLTNGNDGADRLSSIEAAQFTDGTINIGSVAEFRANTATVNDQTGPAITTLSNGAFVMAWESNLQDGSGVGIYAQRYDAAGVAQGAEFRVNTTTASDQAGPAIAAFSDGSFVVTWDSNLQDGSGLGVYAQRYDASGIALGAAFKVNTTTASDQDSPTITELANDDFVITWNSLNQDGSGYGVYAQRYNLAGVAQVVEFRINTTTASDQVSPEISALGDGFVVTWTSGAAGVTNVFAQRYNATGVAQGAQFRVNTITASDQESPAVAELGNGDFVVAWNSLNQDGSGLGVYAQRYSETGVAQGGEFRVNTTTANDQDSPSITGLDDGGFVVTWNSLNQDGGLYGVYGQRFNASGVAQGAEFRVNTTSANDQDSPAVTSLDDGGFMVTWESNLQDGSGFGIFGQRYDASGNAIAATLTGDAGGNSIIWSGTQTVVLDGGAGADTLAGGLGNDHLLGGADRDTASYTSAFRQSVLSGNPVDGASLSGPGGSDTLIGVENLSFLDGIRSYDAAAHIWQIERLYGSAFDRGADALGRNYHSGRLDTGTTLAAIGQDFAASAEFLATYGSLDNGGFVNQLYLNVLNRAADAGGLAYWTSVLDGGTTRGEVLAGFSESAENIANYAAQLNGGLWDIDETAASVARLYRGTLDRAPDAAGLGYWTGQLKSGAQTLLQEASGFVGSAEFQAAYGSLNNSAFVNQLYLNVLDRPADAGGLDYWTGLLNAGTSRAEVTLGFTESGEFQVNMVGQIDNGIVLF